MDVYICRQSSVLAAWRPFWKSPLIVLEILLTDFGVDDRYIYIVIKEGGVGDIYWGKFLRGR